MDNLIEKLEKIETRFMEVEKELASPELMSDHNRLRDLGVEHKELSGIVELVRSLRDTEQEIIDLAEMTKGGDGVDEELRELAEEELTAKKEELDAIRENIRRALVPKDHRDEKDVIIEIRAGTGGDEAAIFAGDLFRMYSRYAETRGWKISIISSTDLQGINGFKEIICEVKGRGAYSRLKFEGGTHRVQRVPVTESGGRIHTSAATVAVLVEPDQVEVQIDENDIRIDTFRASSAGGQHVNKTDSAIRITHFPTGLIVSCQDQRSQHQNKEKAMLLLRAYLLEREEAQRNEQMRDERRSQVTTGDRSAKIRTYNWPQNRVTDHRIHMDQSLQKFIEGDLDPLIDQLNMAREAELLAEVN
ncbi:MAG TPA: peptide chain release factor 1 [bacterium]|jgi:peptide chain release factor 1